MRYTINLTAADVETIAFVGDRYNWSDWAERNLHEGANDLTESQAWAFNDAIREDTQGSHCRFPLLAEDSELYAELNAFVESIV